MATALLKASRRSHVFLSSAKFSPRVRFNWGYHDANFNYRNRIARPDGLTVSDILDRHFDHAYAEGWVEGWNDSAAGAYLETSQPAWDRKHPA